ncbi:PREDICTED: uncharacterized protein LOC109583572 [Amphimedon queenslandica]|uniref:Fibronectin type-III domain-containing protein n=1 Tax=Amphimedon queenslandica TaxID=400682 RepID=A0AAN0JCS3_AMPQE|nr:PREDICTED: uncharacterized protein LOC109583572 [Amphimedon queenslandica]|eukprot:XP_019854546.1 PREDICTED: uncharacterized protein LOC109583572 [Amphimedon queenslandica]
MGEVGCSCLKQGKMLGKMLISVLSLSLAIYSVDSCSTVSRSGVSLTGICPNDSFIVPVGTTLSYECTIGGFTQDYVLYWNVSGTAYNCFNYKPPGISVSLDGSFKIMPNNSEYYIQCGMCKGLNCLLSDDVQEFIATKSIQLIAFGPPSSLSHELRDNDTVKLSWSTPSLPPSVNEDDVSFTYNIMIMESTNSSLTVTDINITNSTYVIISSANINGYAKCTSYQWGVRVAGSLSYGFTNVTMAKEIFTLISGSKISNELAVINDTIEFNRLLSDTTQFITT